MIVNVSNVSGLNGALLSAKSGDTIVLDSGTYSNVEIRNIKFDDGVNIVSKNPGNPAIIEGLTVRTSEGLNFSNIEFKVNPTGLENQFAVYESKSINFDKIEVHGTINGNPTDDQSGLMIRWSSDVKVTNSEFHELGFGLTFLESDSVVVSNNTFHDMRADGVRGAGVSNVKIMENYFTDFFPDADDHPDAIQMWEGTTNPVNKNILIDGNVIARGDGGLMQGIFLRGPQTSFEGVTITNNTVAGGMTNGIYVSNATAVKVANNTVVGADGKSSWIRVEESSNVAVTGNDATKYIFGDQVTGLSQSGNTIIGHISTESLKALEAWIEGDHSKPMPDIVMSDGSGPVAPTVPTVPMEPTEPPPTLPVTPPTAGVTVVGSSGVDNMFTHGTQGTRLEAGAGNDRLTGGEGKNTLVGGAGDDRYFISDTDDVVVEASGGGKDTVFSSANHTLASNVEDLQLLKGATVGVGNSLANAITGTAQDDQLSGLGGADRLVGAEGRDVLLGGDGNDTLSGGAGADTLVGGAGVDSFTFGPADIAGSVAAPDRIEDFSAAQGERIHLSNIDANSLTAANHRFGFIGTEGFHGKAGELRYEVKGGDAYVSADLNGDRIADFKIHLVGVSTLHAEDFVL